MSPLVVEFIGRPGAGKTTIAQNVIEELTVAGYRCFGHSTLCRPEGIEKRAGGFPSKLRTVGQFALACLRHRRLAIDAFFYTVRVNALSLIGLRRLFVFLVRFRFVRSVMNGHYDILILDQGPIQNLWSIATTGGEPASDEYLARVLRDILDEVAPFVVLVDIETDLAMERIAGRSTMRSHFDHMPASSAGAMLSRYGDVFAQLVDLADEFTETGFLRVDGSEPIPDNVSLIVPFIDRGREACGKWPLC